MRRFLLHLLLWTGYVAVEFLANLPHYRDRGELLRETIFYLPLIALPFYFVAYFLVPRLLWRGRKTLFWLSVGGVFFLQMVFRVQWTHWYWLLTSGQEIYMPLGKISKNLFRDYAVIALGVCLKIIRDWDRKDRLTSRLQTEKRDAELQFLRAQIHPHFLFNTLNNLYGLALRQSPHTSDSILKLSGLLDFILYDCNAEHIPVRKEIELIQQFIALEKLRHSPGRLDLNFRHDHFPDSVQIAPLLLLPFVENAFKHGANGAGDRVWIKIALHGNAETLHFQVENSRKDRNGDAGRPNHKKGIGLRNVEKRLELLYPGRFRLQKIEGRDTFLIALQIDRL